MDTIAIIIILAIGVYFIFIKGTTQPRDMNDLGKIIAEVDVLIHYGKNDQAITLLEQAKGIHGSNADIISKLNELRNVSS